MSSLAELPALVGFFSYSREDDEGSGGRLSKLRERIQEELRSQLGRTKADFRLWQDKVAIAHGELWEDTIKKGICESVFFIPIITPTAVRSSYCKFEFESFLAREKELDRNNLIFPILYIPVPALTGDRWRQDPLLAIIGSRQYEQWQNLRHLDASSTEVALRIEKFCANICRALEQEWLSPEERREAEARRAAETERRSRQEAEAKQRADEEEGRRKAEAEERRRDEEERRRQEAITRFDDTALRLAEVKKRQQDEERHRPEPEGKLARKDAQRQKTLEQEPQQSVRQWPLLLIGAAAAALPTLVFWLYISFDTTTKTQYNPSDVFFIAIPALYGGAAGTLLRRFGIPKAVAIPVIPALLLFVTLSIFAPQHGGGENVSTALFLLAPPVICTWLAFWLHSLWVRKRRRIDAGLIPP
jgi:TIR domain